MAGTVRIGLFKFIQKAYQEIGISPSDANQNRKFINSKKWFIPFGLVQFFISSAAYLMIKANSMIEYGMAFYSCMTVLFYFTIYLISFWQMKNLLNYIESCEQFIEQSEYTYLLKLQRWTQKHLKKISCAYFVFIFNISIVCVWNRNAVNDQHIQRHKCKNRAINEVYYHYHDYNCYSTNAVSFTVCHCQLLHSWLGTGVIYFNLSDLVCSCIEMMISRWIEVETGKKFWIVSHLSVQ